MNWLIVAAFAGLYLKWLQYLEYRKTNPPPKRDFPQTHATYERPNKYVEGKGWCKNG